MEKQQKMASVEERRLAELKHADLRRRAAKGGSVAKTNLHKARDKWLSVCRREKLEELKKEVELKSQQFEKESDRRDAAVSRAAVDLEEAEEQHQLAVSTHLLNVKELVRSSRSETLHKQFLASLAELRTTHEKERQETHRRHETLKHELQVVCQQLEKEERQREREEATDHETACALVRNKVIEETHETKALLESRIEELKSISESTAEAHATATDASAKEYAALLQQDALSSKEVDDKGSEVAKLEASIAQWKRKLHQNTQEWSARNGALRSEKDSLLNQVQTLKTRLNSLRNDEHHRLSDLSRNAYNCEKRLKEQLELAEKIMRTWQLCSKLEAEEERIAPYYPSRELSVDGVEWETEQLRDEIKESLCDQGVDEWSYLDKFFKRYNKVLLDKMTLKEEQERLTASNIYLQQVLKQFAEDQSVTDVTLAKPNMLLVVNGKVSPYKTALKRAPEDSEEVAEREALAV